KSWVDYGVPMSTTNDQAAKMYDGLLTQYVGWYDEDSLGGMEGTINTMIGADPNFVMGHVLKNGLEILGTGRTVRLDNELKKDVEQMVQLGTSQSTTDRERKHVNAVKLWADGEMTEACKVWEDILVDHPLDMLALKFAHDSYFYLGHHPQMRDSIARVMPHWKPDMPLQSYLYGMHAFGLEECNQYALAEELARKGLELNKHDAWSTHSMAHVLEMGGRAPEGIKFMSSTENDWNICEMIACHNYWHYGVYNIEMGKHDEALGLFDREVGRRAAQSGALLDLVDACSLLYRLKLEGIPVKERWEDTLEVCKPHVDDHVLTFNDAHILMVALGQGDKDTTDKLIKSLKDFAENGTGDNQKIAKEVGVPLCEAIVAFEEGDYARAVNLVSPIRYRIITIGGSHAQRDVFNLFLIHAAIRSDDKAHHRLARQLLIERKTLKPYAPMTDRLSDRLKEKAMLTHNDQLLFGQVTA
ncbi:hypothetical protein FSP39_007448, partial [Pinctada imbricata]